VLSLLVYLPLDEACEDTDLHRDLTLNSSPQVRFEFLSLPPMNLEAVKSKSGIYPSMKACLVYIPGFPFSLSFLNFEYSLLS
jgi:hypothetical protein